MPGCGSHCRPQVSASSAAMSSKDVSWRGAPRLFALECRSASAARFTQRASERLRPCAPRARRKLLASKFLRNRVYVHGRVLRSAHTMNEGCGGTVEWAAF